MSWIPLHVHSQYSILDASGSPKALAKRAAQYKIPALAMTDHGNLYGAVEFFKACKGADVKPIIGCDLYEAPESRHDKKRIPGTPAGFSLVLLVKDPIGYKNLCKLSSAGFIEGFYYYPRIDREILSQHNEGLVCLCGGTSSRLSFLIEKGDDEVLEKELQWYIDTFGEDFYLELQRHPMSDEDQHQGGFGQESWLQQQHQAYIAKQDKVNTKLIELARKHNIKLVATNDSHYLEKEDWNAHEILLNVQSGEPCEVWKHDSMGKPTFKVPNPKRKTYPSHELYFKTPEQMADLFSDIPEAISNTLEVADKCNMELDFVSKHYPVYIPPNLQDQQFSKEELAKEVETYLRNLCEEGIKIRYTPERLAKVQEVYPDKDPMQVVRDRLEHEMNVIAPKGMCDYLLIVWDFIDWAKRHHIPVGPGRGSGAGSIVLYLIGITDIEPLRFNLFFERFINPERLSYPDIDVDICMDKRGEVINYTLNKYGKDNVAQIITFGTMKAKMAIKDVGRVLNVPLAKVNQIAKLVPDDLNITIEKALEVDPDLRRMSEEDDEAKKIVEIGRRLEGSVRNTGIHAAGIIVAGEPLTENIPICNAKDSDMPVTQFSMKPVESVGMLKIDFLGLKTLTSIQVCVNAIGKRRGVNIDWRNLPLDDKKAFELLNQGKTLGVFQMESGGMQDLARQLHLDKFEEIIAVLSLYRPGPMDMIPSFIERKHGREQIENDHPWMKDILAETYGIMVYQEQVMQIAQKLANYSLGEGDVLRRAMGKKDMEQMAQEREKFRTGAMENGIAEETAMLIFDKMEKFAAYGFNKSHAAAYGYLTYVTAFLKSNYPSEWMAALLTCDRDDISKVSKFIAECQAMNIEILLPDINEAGIEFVATPKGIRFAMAGIKGVGEGVVEAIIHERETNGPFKDFYEFFSRIDTKKVGKKVIENLVDAGCFDAFGWTRDELRQSIDPMYTSAVKERKDNESGVMTLFALMGEDNSSRFSEPPKVMSATSKMDKLLKEKELLGVFLTGHPMDGFRHLLQRLSCVSLANVQQMDNDTVFRAAFIVETVATRISQRTQKKFAILNVADEGERYELPIWPDLYESKGELLEENQILYAVLQVENKDGEKKLSCRWLGDLTKADEMMVRECDEAYDKAKLMVKRFSQRNEAKDKKKNDPKKPAAEKNVKKEPEKIDLTIDAQKVKLSQILAIKELLSDHEGESNVTLNFTVAGHSYASLQLEAEYRAKDGPAVQKKIDALIG